MIKSWLRTHLYINDGKLFGLIKFYRISKVCKAEMVYRHDEFQSNFMCPNCRRNTYNWKWLPYKPKVKTVYRKPVVLYGVMLAPSSIKTCEFN